VADSRGPASDAVNPAASAVQQRFTLDASYIGLVGLGAQRDLGSVINLQASIPTPYGVWGAGTRLIVVPPVLVSLPLGTVFGLRGSFAKDLYPNLWIGAGLSAAYGQRTAADWSLGADLGIVHLLGKLSFMQNFRYGVVLAGLGKWYAPGSATPPSAGASGDINIAYPSPFTAKGGVGFDLFNIKGSRLSATADLSFPFFQNALFDLGLSYSFKESFGVNLGWGINAVEAYNRTQDSFWPSFGFQASIPVTTSKTEDSFLAKQGWSKSEVQPALSAHYLYDGIWAIGGGVTLPLGTIDRKAPKIAVTYPATKYDAYYLSPNADGKNDELVLPLSVKDERYVMGYSLKVLDDKGAVVREIQNKESRPENQGFKGILDRLGYKKAGIPVQPEIKWDGRSDSGQIVPDGNYTFVVTAVDDNGNRGESETFKLDVDSTPPALKAETPSDPTALIFSPDGDGSKEALTIKAAGSAEDAWTVQIRDASGAPVRSFDAKNSALSDITWDGKNDTGQVVPDGVYNAYIATEDRGGNAVEATVDNIIVDTRQPPVSLAIDSAYFSPNADGVRDTVLFTPSVPVKTGLADWSLAVKNASGAEVWKAQGSGADSLKGEYLFDGKDPSGKVLPEGDYSGVLSVRYVNGHKPSVTSPRFALDVTKPKASVKSNLDVFSPNGDGKQDEASFSQTAGDEDLWTGEIRDAMGNLVAAMRFSGKVDPTVTWDGSADSGVRAPDGKYAYRLVSTDKAGNKGESNEAEVQLDTEKKSVMLSVDQRAFSPNKDGQRDSVSFAPSVQANENSSEWKLTIVDPTGNTVRSLGAKGKVPAKISWDGKNDSAVAQPDGTYVATLWVKYNSGDEVKAQAPSVAIDTVAPAIEVAADSVLFSPNGDGLKDTLSVRQSNASADPWDGSILDANAKAVRTYSWKSGAENVLWDGTDAAGNKLPDGKYRYVVSSTDKAGNRTQKSVEDITIDTRETSVYVTATRSGFSPNGDGKFDDLRFSFIVKLKEGVSSWKFELADSSGVARKAWTGASAASIPAQLPWDGTGDDGKVAESAYTGTFTVSYAKGDAPSAKVGPIDLDISAPAVKMNLAPMPFSPDNDGIDDEVTISLAVSDASDIKEWKLEISEAAVEETKGAAAKTRLFMKYEGQGKPAERVTWDGKSLKGELVEAATDYPFSFTVSDSLGNSQTKTGIIPVDVLVIRDGNRLKIKVPSIVFRANFADFNDLAAETVDKNYAVLKRIAEILNKYKSYKVTVEGHANSIGKIYAYSADKIQKEESSEVLPLSQSRAEAVRAFLVKYGVDEKRLSAKGLGSAEAVVDPKDADNRWKNRRVEFILEK
jgi:flagellar hook assembly protein FlgD/outer membrane protein OmpA-like peptidoglycan-associated protein